MNESMPEDILDILEQYSKEYHEDTVLDDFRLREVELKVPGIKGKWASYKTVNYAKLLKLKRHREELLDEGVEIIKNKREDDGNPVSLKGAEYILRKSTKFRELDHKISVLTLLCEYFDDSLKNIQSIGFDIKNLVDTIKMDEM